MRFTIIFIINVIRDGAQLFHISWSLMFLNIQKQDGCLKPIFSRLGCGGKVAVSLQQYLAQPQPWPIQTQTHRSCARQTRDVQVGVLVGGDEMHGLVFRDLTVCVCVCVRARARARARACVGVWVSSCGT